MRNIYIIIALLIGLSSLYAKDMKMIIHQQDGKTLEYNIQDLENISFIKSDMPPLLKIYHKIETLNAEYDIKDIDSLTFSADNEKLLINNDDGKTEYMVEEIDSLVFIYVDNEEVQICDQVWMLKNLDVTHYRNGDPIPEVTNPNEWANLETGAWCYYNNDPVSGEIYGKLYNWYAVNDPRGLAPEGWHVPSDEEWQQMEICLGMAEDELDYWEQRGTNEGSKLAGEHDLWRSGDLRNNSNFDSSGFTALPGGYRYYNYGSFSNIRSYGNWWTSTELSSISAIYRYLIYSSSYVCRNFNYKNYGFSVRCVKD